MARNRAYGSTHQACSLTNGSNIRARSDSRGHSASMKRSNAAVSAVRFRRRAGLCRMCGAARTAASSLRSAADIAASPPSAWKSGTAGTLMKIGSIAIALIAAYGDCWPGAISFSGRQLQHALAGRRQPLRDRRDISDLANAPTGARRTGRTTAAECLRGDVLNGSRSGWAASEVPQNAVDAIREIGSAAARD